MISRASYTFSWLPYFYFLDALLQFFQCPQNVDSNDPKNILGFFLNILSSSYKISLGPSLCLLTLLLLIPKYPTIIFPEPLNVASNDQKYIVGVVIDPNSIV